MQVVLDWPVRPTLELYERRLKDRLRRHHEVATIVWALLAPHRKTPTDAPSPHPLLRD